MRIVLAVCVLALALVAAEKKLSPRDSLAKARVQGTYGMLLHQIKVEKDLASYGEFRDWGHWSGTAYGGQDKLSPGYWVYVHPYWYVWRDKTEKGKAPAKPRSWGPEQATGAPDTPRAGDRPTAWASSSADGQDEWLLLEYEKPIRPIAVVVFATYNPGALTKVIAYALDGTEKLLWKGKDPAVIKEGKGVTILPLDGSLDFNRIRLHLASKTIKGWNEIDAVGLLDADGKMHWAKSAHASSFYGETKTSPTPIVIPYRRSTWVPIPPQGLPPKSLPPQPPK